MEINVELDNYLKTRGPGISRTGINVMAFIGVFIFGWLMAVVFSMLGKARLGWMYVVPVLFINLGLARIEPLLALVGITIYIAAWVHANIILTRYQKTAKIRISEIERETDSSIDILLEKGLILQKVLLDKQAAIDTFSRALSIPEGDPKLLNSAGAAMTANKRYQEASEFLERAETRTQDEELLKQIRKNRKRVMKKLK